MVKTELIAVLNLALESEVKYPVDLKRVEELHPSSFPYCGLRHAYSRIVDGDPSSLPFSAMGSYYTSVGTAAHTFFQAFFSRHVGPENGVLMGDWACKCRRIEFAVRPKNCPKCGPYEYQELAVKYGSRTIGHVDGVFRYKGRYWVIDYKTSSIKTIAAYKKALKKKQKPSLPYTSNVWQISSYCWYLSVQRGLDIAGWGLIYVPRDDPRQFVPIVKEISQKELTVLGRTLRSWDKQFDYVRRVKRFTMKRLEPLIDRKTCDSHEYYVKHVRDSFDECPLAATCFSAKGLRQTLKDSI